MARVCRALAKRRMDALRNAVFGVGLERLVHERAHPMAPAELCDQWSTRLQYPDLATPGRFADVREGGIPLGGPDSVRGVAIRTGRDHVRSRSWARANSRFQWLSRLHCPVFATLVVRKDCSRLAEQFQEWYQCVEHCYDELEESKVKAFRQLGGRQGS